MFLSTTLVYPVVLALLCVGTGLLVDRVSGSFLPLALLPATGLAGLITFTQLCTYVYPLATATPYLVVALAVAGYLAGRVRLRELAGAIRRRPWLLALPVGAYVLALAPVLASGRASFSSYLALADSAVHIAGADYLLHHGQHYAHLDLQNSYGQVINDYYNSNYPSGADTAFGASALLIGLRLIWAFQPFNAFVLASACGAAWLLARASGLSRAPAMVAALTAVLGALVYAYELFGSVKEITALGMILALGALVVLQERWLRSSGRGVIPFALVAAAGVSALGVAFGVWALASALVLSPALLAALREGGGARRGALVTVGLGAAVVLVGALAVWTSAGGSVSVAEGIASTSNPGNLLHALRAIQLFGIWLGGSYKLEPTGVALDLTHALVLVALAGAVVGVWQLWRLRALVALAWFALMLLACLIVVESVSVWGAAKALMMSSPAVVLLAWAGAGALWELRPRALAFACTGILGLSLTAGVLVSDARQYHVSNLAPTARYEELARLNSHFAGRGPTLFTDFDEYALYALRDLDVGGPDFVYPPPAAAAAAAGHGRPVRLDRLAPSVFSPYRLIVTRRDPLASRPPAVYGLAAQGRYYQVWERTPGVAPALRHVALRGDAAHQCGLLGALAHSPTGSRPRALTVAVPPQVVQVPLRRSRHPGRWREAREGLVLGSAGRLTSTVVVPSTGVWDVWVKGQLMRPLQLAVDGQRLATISGELDGNSLVIDSAPPVPVHLSAGVHRLELQRGGASLAPGDGGAAVLNSVLLTPAAHRSPTLRVARAAEWHALCGGRYQWAESSAATLSGALLAETPLSGNAESPSGHGHTLRPVP
jgi:hypothetical protein